MPPIRPILTRTFPRPALSSTSTAPAILSIIAHPISASAPPSGTPRSFSSSTTRLSGDSHDSHYNPPSGWLFGVPPGEKAPKEGWENIWVWGFWGSLGVTVLAYAFKPDTSIQTWALEEARRRLEAEGILPDPATAGEPTKPN